MKDQGIVGQTIRSYREARKWRQEDLSYYSTLCRTQIIRLEAGRYDVRLSTLRKLALAFGIAPSQLLKNLPKD